MKCIHGWVVILLVGAFMLFPTDSHARVYSDVFGVSLGFAHVNNSGYSDVYGSMNWSLGASYNIFFASRRKLGTEFGFRLNYDSGSTTGIGNSAKFTHFPIFAGMKYRFLSDSKWIPAVGAGIQVLFYNESIDAEGFEDASGNSIGYYLNGALHRRWGRDKSTFVEMRFSSNSLDADSSGTGGKTPDAGSFEVLFGVAFGIRKKHLIVFFSNSLCHNVMNQAGSVHPSRIINQLTIFI